MNLNHLAIPRKHTNSAMDLLAQQLYHTYAQSADFKNIIGNPLPSWEKLPEIQQHHWLHVADCVIYSCEQNAANREYNVPKIINIGKSREKGENISTRYPAAIIAVSKHDYLMCLEALHHNAPNIFVGFEFRHHFDTQDMRGHKPRLIIITAKAHDHKRVDYTKLKDFGRGHIPIPVWLMDGYYEKLAGSHTRQIAEDIENVLFQSA